MIVAAMMVSAQAGYCAGPALENLQKLGDVEAISVPVPGSPKAMDGNTLKVDQAFAKLSDLAGATAFEKLKNLFNEGAPAAKADLTGWYSGRMVQLKTPNVFEGTLIIGREEPANPDGGPLFSGELLFEVYLLNNNGVFLCLYQ